MAKKRNSNGNGKTPGSPHPIHRAFSRFAQATSYYTGQPIAFVLAVATIVIWAVTGPVFGYSDTWQLIINTGTTIVTFLMVFLVQSAQYRDTLALQLKLSELVLAMEEAENKYATIEDLTDEELEALHEDCKVRAQQTLESLESRKAKVNAAAKRKKA